MVFTLKREGTGTLSGSVIFTSTGSQEQVALSSPVAFPICRNHGCDSRIPKPAKIQKAHSQMIFSKNI
jgi:hypothetical protein